MRQSLTIVWAVNLACLVGTTCAATIMGFVMFPGSLLQAAIPGILAAILCAIAGAFLLKGAFAPLKDIQRFLESNGKTPLNPHSCGSLNPLAMAAVDRLAAARDREFWYEGILNSLPWAISVTDMDMRWQFCNTASLRSMNKSRNEEIFGLHCSAKKGNICNTPQCGITQLRNGNTKVINCMPNGKTMSISLQYLIDRNDQRVGHVEVGEDITEKIALEEKARKAVAETRQTMVRQIEGVVLALGEGAGGLKASLENVRKEASNAASRLAEAATAMNEMNATVLEVASNAEGAAGAASSVQNDAQIGNELVSKTIGRLHSLRELSMNLKSEMSQLDKQANDIGTVLTLIRDIADQTNLLALNAAIEAARAGEAGRGFAVVADEVRKLAEKTMSATADVENAISSIQDGTRKSSATMDEAVNAIEETGRMGEESGQALGHIAALAADSSMRVSAIAAAATEQSAASEEINRSITEVNHLSGDIAYVMAGAVNQTAELAREAHVLTEVLDKLRNAD